MAAAAGIGTEGQVTPGRPGDQAPEGKRVPAAGHPALYLERCRRACPERSRRVAERVGPELYLERRRRACPERSRRVVEWAPGGLLSLLGAFSFTKGMGTSRSIPEAVTAVEAHVLPVGSPPLALASARTVATGASHFCLFDFHYARPLNE